MLRGVHPGRLSFIVNNRVALGDAQATLDVLHLSPEGPLSPVIINLDLDVRDILWRWGFAGRRCGRDRRLWKLHFIGIRVEAVNHLTKCCMHAHLPLPLSLYLPIPRLFASYENTTARAVGCVRGFTQSIT